MKKSIFLVCLITIAIAFMGGCTSNEFNDVQHAIEKQIQPAKVEKHIKLGFGPALLFPFKVIAKIFDTEGEVSPYLNEVCNVQVGIYKIKKTEQSSKLNIPATVEKILNESGWERFIRVQKDKGEGVELYFKEIEKDVVSIFIVVLDNKDLILVETSGRIENIIEKAIKEHGMNLKEFSIFILFII